MIALILFVQAGICFLLLLTFRVLQTMTKLHEEAGRQHLADSVAIIRIEKKLEDIGEAIESESERIIFGQEFHAGKVNEFTRAEIKALVDVMREVVHETPDFAITGEDGEVPVRRMRGLRSALSRMEELSRMAAGE